VTPAERAGEIEERGYTVLENAVPKDKTQQLRDRLTVLLDALDVPLGANPFLGTRTRRLFNLLARDRVFERVPIDEVVLPVVEALLDGECLLSSLTGIEMQPGETDQAFHADDGSLPLPRPHAALTSTAIWALTDFDEENGGTRIVPGSHRADRIPRKGEAPTFEHVEMKAGSVLVNHGSLWHGGGANRSASPRLAIVCNYCAGFLRQEESQLLALPRERVRAFAPRLQQLVGYGTYRGLLGHVDTESPQRWLDPKAETDMVWRRMR